MKTLVLTEGGLDIGLGHLSRCAGIFHAIRQRSDSARVEFVVKGDEKAGKFLEWEGIACLSLSDWAADAGNTIEKAKNYDLVVIDSYIAEKKIYDGISAIPGKKVLMLDDYNRIEYPEGTVVNTSIPEEGPGRACGRRAGSLTGSKYIILRKEFWDVPEKKINKEIKNVLVTFGGTDYSSLLEDISVRLRRKFGVETGAVDGAKLRIDGASMTDRMIEADICISGGGQTVCELARCGVPTIAISFADNQNGNLRAFERAGTLKYAGKHDSPDLMNRLEALFEEMMPQDVRKGMSERGRKMVDGKGAMRILDDLDASIRIRKATDEDCRDIWAWRNDPAVRKWCFSAKEISYDEHSEWFRKKISAKGSRLYILEDSFGGKVAQVRFEADGESAAININLNPAYIGRGYGKKAISVSTEAFFRENSAVNEVIAEIIEGNTASERAFTGAGYGFSHNESKQGKKMSVYKRTRDDGIFFKA